MLNSQEYNIFGNLIDTTFGKTSQLPNQPPTRGLKWQLISNDKVLATCTYIVHIGNITTIVKDKDKNRKESLVLIDAAVGSIKKRFKEQAERTLKMKNVHIDDSLQITHTIPGPAIYIVRVMFDIE